MRKLWERRKDGAVQEPRVGVSNYVASTLADDVASDVARKLTAGKVAWNCLFK